jgi:hypothetical protein
MYLTELTFFYRDAEAYASNLVTSMARAKRSGGGASRS